MTTKPLIDLAIFIMVIALIILLIHDFIKYLRQRKEEVELPFDPEVEDSGEENL